MIDWIIAQEPLVRGIAFAAILLASLLWETAAPARLRVKPRVARWIGNGGLVLLDTVMLRLAFPILAVGVAAWADAEGVGLFNWLSLPAPVEILAAILILDCAIYWQHVAFHRIPVLWRLHRVHHADHDVDVTTALRFHPIEIAVSMVIKIAIVAGLGLSAAGVILFEIILSGMALFNHANGDMPKRIDGMLRSLIVTPAMHRIHHSRERIETNSNFGFNLSLWDRLFGTYTPEPRRGDGLVTGLDDYDRAPTDSLLWMLFAPFRGKGFGESHESIAPRVPEGSEPR